MTLLAPIRRRCASAYRAGPGLDEALAVCRRLAAGGLASTVGYAARRGEPAARVADAHVAAFDRLATEDLDCYVSVKLTALEDDEALFAALEAAAQRSGRRLHLDALGPDATDAIWRRAERSGSPHRLGVTLPGRWRRSACDATRAVDLGVAVRVVKGQWPAGADADADPAEGFLRVVDGLRDAARPVSVATHDARLSGEALRRLIDAGTPCAAELFYGLPFRAAAGAARDLGVPIRVYVPYGDAGAPYGSADLRANPAAMWWLTQDLLLGETKTWRSIRRSRPQR
jgi:proline dehydrogenase